MIKIHYYCTDGDGIEYRNLDSDNDLCDVLKLDLQIRTEINFSEELLLQLLMLMELLRAAWLYNKSNYIIAALLYSHLYLFHSNLGGSKYFNNDNGDSYQWQLSTNGTTWQMYLALPYSNATTNTLTITSVTNGMNGFKYRVQLNKIGNSCGLNSNETTLTVYPLPVVNVTLLYDDDLNAITSFNLTVKTM
jgi:hypothetical protein